MQQFLDKHSRSCWRPTPRCALFLRRVTPTRSHFSRPDVAFVCAALPATPYSSVRPRQRDRKLPGRTSPLLASHSPLRLISSSGHANAVPLFPGGRRLCWRRPPRYALFLRRATPTRPGFSRADTAFVGAALPATPYSSIGPRQHDRKFPSLTPPLLASPSPLRFIPPSGHANTTGNFPGGRRLCWRRPTRCALFLRLATPTPSGFSRADAGFVGAALPAAPYSSVGSRQHRSTFPGQTSPLFAPPYPLRLIPSPRHANTTGNFQTCWRIGILGN